VATAFVALGANLGDRLAAMRAAVGRLGLCGEVLEASPVYETEPVGYRDQPAFLNAVVKVDTALSPRALLDELLRIEAERGRVRTFRNAPRALDLDLLLYDELVIDEPGLTVPHPRLHERAFVLWPLADIAGAVVHPILKRSISDLRRGLQTPTGVRKLPDPLIR
jgi:2-amino-4-hydroxy-6-hydroxymethyldihydropteridine diphosphokinase